MQKNELVLYVLYVQNKVFDEKSKLRIPFGLDKEMCECMCACVCICVTFMGRQLKLSICFAMESGHGEPNRLYFSLYNSLYYLSCSTVCMYFFESRCRIPILTFSLFSLSFAGQQHLLKEKSHPSVQDKVPALSFLSYWFWLQLFKCN